MGAVVVAYQSWSLHKSFTIWNSAEVLLCCVQYISCSREGTPGKSLWQLSPPLVHDMKSVSKGFTNTKVMKSIQTMPCLLRYCYSSCTLWTQIGGVAAEEDHFRVVLEGSSYIIAYNLALHREEVPLVELHGLCANWNQDCSHSIPHVVITLLRYFKWKWWSIPCGASCCANPEGAWQRLWIRTLID
jgi:hypothetical protein